MLRFPDMKAASATLVAAVLLLASCGWLGGEAAYESFAAAEKAGAVKRGFVPEWLPKSSSNLKEKHERDGSASILRFTFDVTEKWPLPSACKQVEGSKAPPPRLKAAWWPNDVPASAAGTPRHLYFACGQGLLAIDMKGLEGFFWKP